ncbi:hypothetical protein Lgra_2812 [Legionella gratiana]|uniref:Uncharacterized protein n=1 Tax=Legionella gratiana TaxID=45066 RepID=A0A378JDJ4_9GAMM|nr:hypothetical protein [Legionella gratiana]KTD06035.1 hypothetical protein Lgra_2812 [Legionella gratiana]STX42700.1 Uncharacterised protein [Legionella gratiana]
MKSHKERHQPVSELMTTEDPKTSSIALMLQQFRKETEKKEAAEESAKIRCRVCFKEVAPTRRCSGHGGGGGGGGGDGSSSKTSEEKASPGEDNSLTKEGKVLETTDALIDEFALGDSGALDAKSFDPDIIAELIAKGQLLIDNDRESMTLTIKLLCEPNLLTGEQREELKKFMEVIFKESNDFKEENHLTDDCIQIIQDEEGNIRSLRITMPTLALYDLFIQRLANNLVPAVQEKNEVSKDQRFSPNPFSIEPKPSPSTTGKNFEKEEEQEIFNPSPFKMTPW